MSTDGWHDMELEMPFVVCRSKGGPYDDDAFTAGFQAGGIDQALASAAASHATSVHFPIVHTALTRQLDLIGMRWGFPSMHLITSPEWPQWCTVTFYVEGANPHDDDH